MTLLEALNIVWDLATENSLEESTAEMEQSLIFERQKQQVALEIVSCHLAKMNKYEKKHIPGSM